MQRIAVIAGVLHSGGKRNLIMEYYRHIDRTKLLQKSEMRKVIVIELSYKGFS